jgi:hypothetical protein
MRYHVVQDFRIVQKKESKRGIAVNRSSLTCEQRCQLVHHVLAATDGGIGVLEQVSVLVGGEEVGNFARVHGGATADGNERVEVPWTNEIYSVLKTEKARKN